MLRKQIKVPEDLQIFALDGVTPIVRDGTSEPMISKFQAFIEGRTIDAAFLPLDENRWTMAPIIQAKRVRDAFRDKKPGDVVELPLKEWERLRVSTEAGSYNPHVASSLVPFMLAVVDAKTIGTDETPAARRIRKA